MLSLRPRLKMAADMVRDGVVVADIGTDHAYLPAYLLLNNKISGAIAADLRKKPLENAHATLVTYDLDAKIPLILSNGLDNLKPDSADDIVIAGMGGTLIVEILQRCDWIFDNSKRLVIQPMSHAEDVRKFFMQNGFEILKEDVTIDSGRIYIAINAVFANKDYSEYPESFAYIGKLCESKNPAAKEFLKKHASRLKKRADSLKSIGREDCEVERLYTINLDIERCVENGNS
ncbi:MAG: SAM-dependent methyltransferase [Clostridia bacterium]|nr:SAM-dependent methyltransferase [Clostridia bacterium]